MKKGTEKARKNGLIFQALVGRAASVPEIQEHLKAIQHYTADPEFQMEISEADILAFLEDLGVILPASPRKI